MNILDNLNDAKSIAIGEHFIFGKYQNEPIEWRKIDEHLAISEKALDCIIFNYKFNTKYSESTIRKWCNDVLGKSLGLAEDVINVLDEEKYEHYFPTRKSRQCKATEWAIMHGIYISPNDDCACWTSSSVVNTGCCVCIVDTLGLIRHTYTDDNRVGIRPVIKF